MQLSWTTFLLEIVNFLILVWILKRFFYKPVLNVIARRQKRVEGILAEADAKQEEAETLKAQYENRLGEWEKERSAAFETLHTEIEEERRRRLAELDAALEREKEKAQALERRRLEDAVRRGEEKAIEHGAKFAARLLSELSDEQLEKRLIDLAVQQLAHMSAEQQDAVRSAYASLDGPIKITTAHSLDDKDRQSLQAAIEKVLDKSAPYEYGEDADLQAGIRLIIGPWIFRANLADELKAFVESAHE